MHRSHGQWQCHSWMVPPCRASTSRALRCRWVPRNLHLGWCSQTTCFGKARAGQTTWQTPCRWGCLLGNHRGTPHGYSYLTLMRRMPPSPTLPPCPPNACYRWRHPGAARKTTPLSMACLQCATTDMTGRLWLMASGAPGGPISSAHRAGVSRQPGQLKWTIVCSAAAAWS